MDWNNEMESALAEDGEKLRQLTGEDHGPWRLIDCPMCGGSGRSVGHSRHDPDGQDLGPCLACNGTGSELVDDEPITLSDLDAISAPAPQPGGK